MRNLAHALERLRPVERADDIGAERHDGLTGKALTPRAFKQEQLAVVVLVTLPDREA
jgi:hypothetical protein